MAIPLVGLIVGAIFGASLVLTGLADPDKIIGSLRLKDFHALRTVIVSVLVAMLGVWLLSLRGAVHVDIKTAAILLVLIGGAFVGIGVGLTGFCPVTGLACAASGRIDALVAIIGMFVGAHVYILVYPAIVPPLEKIANYGEVTLPQITGTPQIVWTIPLAAAGLIALVLTRKRGPALIETPTAPDRSVSAGALVSVNPSSIEATGVFRLWKNSLFLVIVLCLLCLQVTFWLMNTGQVQISGNAASSVSEEQTSTEANPSASETLQTRGPALPRLLPFELTFTHIKSVLNPVNAILIFACVLYSLTMYIALSVSIRSRLGGLAHVSRAFYFSLVALLLLLPWQIVLAPVGVGVIFTPGELAKSCTTLNAGTYETANFYLRFAGMWAVVCLVLIMAHWRSYRWAKAVLIKHDDAGRHIG